MAKTRFAVTVVAAGVAAAGISATVAWAGGPDGADGPDTTFRAVGTGTFEDFQDGPGLGSVEAGFFATGATADEAASAVIGACQTVGGQDCSSDMVSNDNLCIVSVGDDDVDVVSGGAGVTVEAARLDAIQRAAANDMPMSPASPVIISACP